MDRMDLGSEQPEKKISKKLKARRKGDECRGVFMGQYLDSHISDVRAIFSLAFRFQRNLKTELSALQVCGSLPGCCGGTHASAGCPKKEGEQLCIIRCPFRTVCIHVCSN